MSEPNEINYDEMNARDAEAGQRTQERIQFYFLTLTFTLLALALQTYEKGPYLASAIYELCGWFCLLVSGILGLYRMHLIPKYFKLSIHANTLRQNLADAERLKREGNKELCVPNKEKKFDIELYIKEHKEGIAHFDKEEKKLTKHLEPVHKIHELGLIVGIVFITISRAYETIISIFGT